MNTYDYFTRARSLATKNTEPSMTDQSQADETDINVIVKRYAQYGTVPQGGARPVYGDFTGIPPDYRQMIELARSAEDIRQGLPEQIRHMEIQDLLALTDKELQRIFAPEQSNTQPTEEKK